MLSFYQARDQVLEAILPMPIEQLSLLEAAGRAVAEDVIAGHPLPPFDNSAMDGYAVQTGDCHQGAVLSVTGFLPAGARPTHEVTPGTAIKIMTGAPVPAGADTVIPLEETTEEGNNVTILGEVKAGDHIRWRGEDIRVGDVVLKAGTLLRPSEISLLASLGMPQVPVRRPPRVAILSTGDELLSPDQPRHEWAIIDSNSWALAAAVRETGAEPCLLGIARDNLDDLREKISAGLEADVLITSAGVSAGDRDLVREVLVELGIEERFWKINIKPGKPTAFGLRGTTPVFSLPGNPVSALMIFEQFVRPALLKMMGHQNPLRPVLKATLKEPMKNRSGRLALVRINLCQEGLELVAYNAGNQQSGILSTSLQANAVAILSPEQLEYAAGDEVDVLLCDSLAEQVIR